MKKFTFLFLSAVIILTGCKQNDIDNSNTILYKSINKEYVLTQDKNELQNKNDEISLYIDSIIDGTIQSNFITTGQRSFDLNGDQNPDISFEILDLRPFNPNGIPDHFDTLAARALPVTVQIRDNSTFGYCDALNTNDTINHEGNWRSQLCVLGTFANAGQFQGQGEKYLAFRFNDSNGFKYGWIRIYCSQHNDTLRIIDYAYNTEVNSNIKAGQTE